MRRRPRQPIRWVLNTIHSSIHGDNMEAHQEMILRGQRKLIRERYFVMSDCLSGSKEEKESQETGSDSRVGVELGRHPRPPTYRATGEPTATRVRTRSLVGSDRGLELPRRCRGGTTAAGRVRWCARWLRSGALGAVASGGWPGRHRICRGLLFVGGGELNLPSSIIGRGSAACLVSEQG